MLLFTRQHHHIVQGAIKHSLKEVKLKDSLGYSEPYILKSTTLSQTALFDPGS